MPAASADGRTALLTAALGFAQMQVPWPRELRVLHAWLDTWAGVRAIAGAMRAQDHALTIQRVSGDGWTATFTFVGKSNLPPAAPSGLATLATPWQAVQVGGVAGGEARVTPQVAAMRGWRLTGALETGTIFGRPVRARRRSDGEDPAVRSSARRLPHTAVGRHGRLPNPWQAGRHRADVTRSIIEVVEPRRQPHALVVEDHEDSRFVTCELLEAVGIRCTGAASATDALAIADLEDLDVVVTDISLSGDRDGGVWLLNKLRSTSRGARIPVVALTGRAERAEELHRLGFAAVVVKPAVEDLVAIVTGIVGH